MDKNKKALIMDIHIPYCIRPENYLNHSYTIGTNIQKNAYMAALKREILSYAGESDAWEIRAVRLSGGSATVMSPDLLGDLLTTIRKNLPVGKGAEVSFDAHPLTIGTPALTGIAAGHPNRAELKMRSENDHELQTLNCAFTMQNVRNAMLFFHRFHLNNVSLTVNYGIPGQTMLTWHNTLHSCVIMQANHICTDPLAETSMPGCPDEAMRLQMYEHACEYLTENGYRQYAIGRFCKPGYEHLFEVLQMNNTESLGLGVGAFSLYDGYVIRNTNNTDLYIRNAGDFEKVTAQVFTADDRFLIRHYVAGRLWLEQGLEKALFQQQFGRTLPDEIADLLKGLAARGWAEETGDAVRLTRKGQFYYDTIRQIIAENNS